MLQRIRLLTLAAEGEILVPFRLEVLETDQGENELFGAQYTGMGWRNFPTFTLSRDDTARYEQLVEREDLLETMGYLNVAFGLFRESYHLHQMYGFLMLFSALEAVLGGNESNLKEKLSWRSVVILNDMTDGPDSVKERVRSLYKLRCDVLHANLVDEKRSYSVTYEDMIEVRGITRRVIVKALELGLDKKSLLELLDGRSSDTS